MDNTLKKPLSFSASPELHERLDHHARLRGMTRSELIRELIEKSLDQVQPSGPKLELQVGFIQLAVDAIIEHGYEAGVRAKVHALHKVYRETYAQPGSREKARP